MKRPKKPEDIAVPSFPDDTIERMFEGGFGRRDEANAITAYCFRNGMIEDLHAGQPSLLLKDSQLSRITDAEMKTLMIEESSKLAELLTLRETAPEEYSRTIRAYALMYCRGWER